jgi:hypothetical protein
LNANKLGPGKHVEEEVGASGVRGRLQDDRLGMHERELPDEPEGGGLSLGGIGLGLPGEGQVAVVVLRPPEDALAQAIEVGRRVLHHGLLLAGDDLLGGLERWGK